MQAMNTARVDCFHNFESLFFIFFPGHATLTWNTGRVGCWAGAPATAAPQGVSICTSVLVKEDKGPLQQQLLKVSHLCFCTSKGRQGPSTTAAPPGVSICTFLLVKEDKGPLPQ